MTYTAIEVLALRCLSEKAMIARVAAQLRKWRLNRCRVPLNVALDLARQLVCYPNIRRTALLIQREASRQRRVYLGRHLLVARWNAVDPLIAANKEFKRHIESRRATRQAVIVDGVGG
jgi:hypothetical protein